MDRFNGAGGARSSHSEERDNNDLRMNYKTNTLPIHMSGGRERCVSMPMTSSGHFAATPTSMPMTSSRGKSPAAGSTGEASSSRAVFHHYGSSLSLSNGSSAGDITSRTLRPPSPTTLKKSSLPGRPKYATLDGGGGGGGGRFNKERSGGGGGSSGRPSLPSLNSVQLQSPKLADYLEKPRLVSLNGAAAASPSSSSSRAAASEHHAKRLNAGSYRNLRLGNFIESGESNEEELIPERLRAYYLDTYLNVCDTCESKTHLDPTSPIQRGM